MANPKLLRNKPLVEAIFEVRWELAGTTTAMGPSDPLYDIMVGAMLSKLRKDFPSHVRLPAAQVPGALMPYLVQHQFRATPSGWPLVQVGSGVLTVNDTEGYASEKFLPLCLGIFQRLREFWQENGHEPKIVAISLRYVDADALNGKAVEAFLKQLDVNIDFGSRIYRSGKISKDLQPFVLNTRMQCTSPKGFVSLNFSRGLKEGKDAMIWETNISSEGIHQCEPFLAAPEKWLNEAHTTAHDLFFSMIEGDLLEKYK